MGTYEIDTISLSCFNDKRFVLNDGIHTLAYFHKDIDSYKKIKNKKEFSQKEEILTDKKDSKRVFIKNFHKKKRFSQMITNEDKCAQINSQQAG